MSFIARICVITSGIGRFYDPCTFIVKKQLGLERNSIDFFGLLWEPVNDEQLKSYTNGFRHSTIWSSPQRQFDDLPDVYKAPETILKNFLSMSWGRWLLFQQMTQNNIWEQYDVFIYCRPDVCFNHSLNFSEMSTLLESHDLLVPSNGHWRGGINDQVAFGGRELATYLNMFPKIVQYIGDGVLLHPETMLLHHLNLNGVRHFKLPIVNYLFRSESEFSTG
jgi:hypothetical protein